MSTRGQSWCSELQCVSVPAPSSEGAPSVLPPMRLAPAFSLHTPAPPCPGNPCWRAVACADRVCNFRRVFVQIKVPLGVTCDDG